MDVWQSEVLMGRQDVCRARFAVFALCSISVGFLILIVSRCGFSTALL